MRDFAVLHHDWLRRPTEKKKVFLTGENEVGIVSQQNK